MSEPDVLVPDARTLGYLRKLRALLSVATFFNGYDGFVISLVLPLILGNLGGSESEAGVIRAVVGVGAGTALVALRVRSRHRTRKQHSRNPLDLAARTIRDAADEARRILPGR